MAVGELLEIAKETGTVLEINSYPDRLDLGDYNILAAKQAGVKMVINTDAHHIDQLRYMPYGISQARRGWAEPEDIVNVWPVQKIFEPAEAIRLTTPAKDSVYFI